MKRLQILSSLPGLGALVLALLPLGAQGQDEVCTRLHVSRVECDPDVKGRFQITFQIENASQLNVDRLFFYSQSQSLVVSPDEHILPPIPPGAASGDLGVTLDIDPAVKPAACVDLSVHDSATGACCATKQVCFDLPACEGGPVIHRADANFDGKVDISDAIVVLGYLFLGLPGTTCLKTMDIDDNSSVEITDAIYLLTYLFLGTRPPPPPFPKCGVDTTADKVTCESYPFCP